MYDLPTWGWRFPTLPTPQGPLAPTPPPDKFSSWWGSSRPPSALCTTDRLSKHSAHALSSLDDAFCVWGATRHSEALL